MNKYTCTNCPESFDTVAELTRHECKRRYTFVVQQDPGFADTINPQHYKSLGARCACGKPIQCIDVTRHMNFNIGNVVKYLWRADHKGDRQEQLKKAHWYLRDEIRKQEPEFDANE